MHEPTRYPGQGDEVQLRTDEQVWAVMAKSGHRKLGSLAQYVHALGAVVGEITDRSLAPH
ncbi:hypothetical protein [Promicromonospora sp. NPDC023805]|uniref:hypothetical protein n=1 Tax=Promicromonospora sp. NPDC023805 TaxID=3154696 RepID=UPI0033E533A6